MQRENPSPKISKLDLETAKAFIKNHGSNLLSFTIANTLYRDFLVGDDIKGAIRMLENKMQPIESKVHNLENQRTQIYKQKKENKKIKKVVENTFNQKKQKESKNQQKELEMKLLALEESIKKKQDKLQNLEEQKETIANYLPATDKPSVNSIVGEIRETIQILSYLIADLSGAENIEVLEPDLMEKAIEIKNKIGWDYLNDDEKDNAFFRLQRLRLGNKNRITEKNIAEIKAACEPFLRVNIGSDFDVIVKLSQKISNIHAGIIHDKQLKQQVIQEVNKRINDIKIEKARQLKSELYERVNKRDWLEKKETRIKQNSELLLKEDLTGEETNEIQLAIERLKNEINFLNDPRAEIKKKEFTIKEKEILLNAASTDSEREQLKLDIQKLMKDIDSLERRIFIELKFDADLLTEKERIAYEPMTQQEESKLKDDLQFTLENELQAMAERDQFDTYQPTDEEVAAICRATHPGNNIFEHLENVYHKNKQDPMRELETEFKNEIEIERIRRAEEERKKKELEESKKMEETSKMNVLADDDGAEEVLSIPPLPLPHKTAKHRQEKTFSPKFNHKFNHTRKTREGRKSIASDFINSDSINPDLLVSEPNLPIKKLNSSSIAPSIIIGPLVQSDTTDPHHVLLTPPSSSGSTKTIKRLFSREHHRHKEKRNTSELKEKPERKSIKFLSKKPTMSFATPANSSTHSNSSGSLFATPLLNVSAANTAEKYPLIREDQEPVVLSQARKTNPKPTRLKSASTPSNLSSTTSSPQITKKGPKK